MTVTLADVLNEGGGKLPPGWDAKAHALLLPEEVRDAVLAAQDPELQHRIQPVQVSGWPPYGIGADILSERWNLFRPIFDRLGTDLAGQVLIVAFGDFVARVPQPQEPTP